MKIAKIVVLVLLIVLGVTSGVAKIMLMPQEVQFFVGAGFSEDYLMLFGAGQIAGGLLLIVKRVRIIGVILLILTFAGSSFLIFIDGNTGFGVFSLLPILLLTWFIRESLE